MDVRFEGSRPVYTQIAERIINMVLSGTYKPGEQLPTVRQLALDVAVNPNTVQRAYAELEHNGLILSCGTAGRFVTEDPAVIEAVRKEVAVGKITTFAEEMKQLSMTSTEVMELVREVMA